MITSSSIAFSTKAPALANSTTIHPAKSIAFAGSKFIVSPHIRLEADFIQALADTQNTAEKAGIAEILGRAHSINAIPALLSLVNPNEAPNVRLSAIQALGDVGDSTHKNSFTRTQINDQLIPFYLAQKKAAMEQPAKPKQNSLASLSEKLSGKKKLIDPAVEELNKLLEVIGRLNTAAGEPLLTQEFSGAITAASNFLKQEEQWKEMVAIAENKFKRHLEEEYKKPFQEILPELSPTDLHTLKSKIVISFNGQKIRLNQASLFTKQLRLEQETLARLLEGTIDGLGRQNTKTSAGILKQGLTLNNPKVQAKIIALLAEKNMLDYSREIAPYLISENPALKSAAFRALVLSSDEAAKQKVIELLHPKTFFMATGGQLSLSGLKAYAAFINSVAQAGDLHMENLQQTAINPRMPKESRKAALLAMRLIASNQFKATVSPATVESAADTLGYVALKGVSPDPLEKHELRAFSSKLWLVTKNPLAIHNALGLAANELDLLSTETQEDLLMDIYDALQINDENPGFDENAASRLVLKSLKQTDAITIDAQELKEIEKQLGTTNIRRKFSPKAIRRLATSDNINPELAEILHQNIEIYRPILHTLMNHKESANIRMVSIRLLGALMDNFGTSVDGLIEKVRNPLKGMINWEKEQSLPMPPSTATAKIRLNALAALARLGNPKALDVMLDALDDPTLKKSVLSPLGQLASSLNAGAGKEASEKIQRKLLPLLYQESNSRQARALRIAVAGTLCKVAGGIDLLKTYLAKTTDPNFKRQVISALVSNDYALNPDHPDHALVQDLLAPELNVASLHQQGITGKGIEIGIIDGGYVDKGYSEAFQNRVKLPADAKKPEHTHPTMVATTAAGNGRIKGVAPDATIYSDKWPDLNKEEPMDVYKKIIEGKLRGENNIRVINNSWGLTNNDVLIFKDLRDALSEFKKVVLLAERAGIQIVFSAGNSGEGPGFPGVGSLSLFGLDMDKLTAEEKEDMNYILENVILVGAVNTQGLADKTKHQMAEFSSIGDTLQPRTKPTVVAPGVDMMVYSNEEGVRGKDLVNGTSFSGPYVSGLVALMMQVNPKLSPKQVRDILTSTAVKLPDVPDTYQGYGEVDPEAAIAKAESLKKPVPLVAVTPIQPPETKPSETKPAETKLAEPVASEQSPGAVPVAKTSNAIPIEKEEKTEKIA